MFNYIDGVPVLKTSIAFKGIENLYRLTKFSLEEQFNLFREMEHVLSSAMYKQIFDRTHMWEAEHNRLKNSPSDSDMTFFYWAYKNGFLPVIMTAISAFYQFACKSIGASPEPKTLETANEAIEVTTLISFYALLCNQDALILMPYPQEQTGLDSNDFRDISYLADTLRKIYASYCESIGQPMPNPFDPSVFDDFNLFWSLLFWC